MTKILGSYQQTISKGRLGRVKWKREGPDSRRPEVASRESRSFRSPEVQPAPTAARSYPEWSRETCAGDRCVIEIPAKDGSPGRFGCRV